MQQQNMEYDHQIAKGEDYLNKAEKTINGWWALFSNNKNDEAAELYQKAANSFKLAKAWDRAGLVFIKLAECYLKSSDSKHYAADAYAEAAKAYKNISSQETISSLEQAVNCFMEIGSFNIAAKHCKSIGELYENEQNFELAIVYFQRSVDLFQSEEMNTYANQCKLKVAEISAQLEQYPKAIEIYEEIAKQSLNNNHLKYNVKGYLLHAGLCQLCKGDIVAITNALEIFQELDPTFSGTREYKLLADLATALDEEDVAKFTEAVREFDRVTRLDYWKITILLRAKEALKAKELEEDDLT